MTRFDAVVALHTEKCPECGHRGYKVTPSHEDCKVCLKLRVERQAKVRQHAELCPKASVTLYDEEHHPECTCSPACGGTVNE